MILDSLGNGNNATVRACVRADQVLRPQHPNDDGREERGSDGGDDAIGALFSGGGEEVLVAGHDKLAAKIIKKASVTNVRLGLCGFGW